MKLLFLLPLLSLFGNKTSDNGIAYRRLSWADYRGAIPNDEPWAASTATQLVLITTEDNDHYTFGVTAYFLPDSSYVRVRSESILRHEQTHFRIAYLLARECMEKLRSWQDGVAISAAKADSIYSRYCDVSNDMNREFDFVTAHGTKAVEEKACEDRISARLSKLVLKRM